MKTITSELHDRAVGAIWAKLDANDSRHAIGPFSKRGESQASALKRYDQMLKRRRTKIIPSKLPVWYQGMTRGTLLNLCTGNNGGRYQRDDFPLIASVRDYVETFYKLNNLKIGDLSRFSDKPPSIPQTITP